MPALLSLADSVVMPQPAVAQAGVDRLAVRLLTAMRRHRGRLGLWIAALMLCALTLQGLQHYQPRMLLGGELCTAAQDDAAAPADAGQAGHAGAHCDLCCAQSHLGAAPPVAAVVAHAPTQALQLAPARAAVPPAGDYPANHPRAPPAA